MKPTLSFRHVWRIESDGNGEQKVLALQQWHEVEGWEHSDFIKQGGKWEDIPIVFGVKETKDNPSYSGGD
jgi:hypothetical protein